MKISGQEKKKKKNLWCVIESDHRVINCVIRCDVWQGQNHIKTSVFSVVKARFKKKPKKKKTEDTPAGFQTVCALR